MVNKHYRIPDHIYEMVEKRDANVFRTDIDYICEAVTRFSHELNNERVIREAVEDITGKVLREVRAAVREEMRKYNENTEHYDEENARQVIREELHELEMRLRPPVEFGPDDPEWWKEEYEWKRRAWIRFHLPERDWPESMRNDRFLLNWLKRPPREEEK